MDNRSVEKWIEFYRPFFGSDEEVKSFVKRCEELPPENNTAKIMMHQTQRLVTIADDIIKIKPGRYSLQILFLIICAECIAKLFDGYKEEGKSKQYVKSFFDKFLSNKDKRGFEDSFSDVNMNNLGFDKTVELLYEIRCNVVHEGKYWDFTFNENDCPMLSIIDSQTITVYLSYQDLRGFVIRGCIGAISDKLSKKG